MYIRRFNLFVSYNFNRILFLISNTIIIIIWKEDRRRLLSWQFFLAFSHSQNQHVCMWCDQFRAWIHSMDDKVNFWKIWISSFDNLKIKRKNSLQMKLSFLFRLFNQTKVISYVFLKIIRVLGAESLLCSLCSLFKFYIFLLCVFWKAFKQKIDNKTIRTMKIV